MKEKKRSAKNEEEAYEEIPDPSKMKVECICPKCGNHHVVNFHWIGRGMPRKYCSNCRIGS